ncbi:MAG: Trk system potassium transporter TrkA [Chromatiales bacterium]|nr:Trk system potassium transporter TrkA [Chromatiales bacterium]
MNILILGAGQVGSTAAYNLAKDESNDVTVVDLDGDVLRELQDRLDIRTVQGEASHPDVLERAGASDCDMVIALTDSDEVNIVACQVCYSLFHTPTKIARIRSAAYINHKELFSRDSMPVDVRISPEQLVCEYVEQLIKYPGAMQALEFANGRVRLIGVKARQGGLLVGQKIRALRQHIPDVDSRVAAIYRDGKAVPPTGETVIEDGDEVFFIAARKDIRAVMSEMRKLEDPVRRVFIAGGGNIGFQLAKALEQTNHVRIIERNPDRAKKISEQLNRSVVLCGDAADEELLLEENIDNADVFVALTNAEEANILSAMLAKSLGAHKVMALINRPSYAALVEQAGIDIAISPQEITIGALLTHLRRGDVVRVHSLRTGSAEAIEAIAHGDEKTSKVVGRAIEDIKLPRGADIAAVVRGDQVLMAHHDTVIQADDHVILFITERKRALKKVEQLFQVSVGYL